MGDLDRCYHRPERFQPYGSAAFDRGLEIVSRSYIKSPPREIPPPPPQQQPPRRRKGGNISSSDGGLTLSAGDPELKRRRRVANYKAYAVEGKVKASIRKGLRWIKGKCADLAHVF